MAKEVVFKNDARSRMKKGIDTVAEAVRATIGPLGRNAILDKGYGSPTITNDGVSIAKEISLKDPIENMGASVIKEVASKTNENAGDGTSTATVLTHEIISQGMKVVAMGANPMNLKAGISKAGNDIAKALEKRSQKVSSQEEIIHVASVSAESEEIGTIIAETIGKVGKDGVVTVEESQSLGTSSEVVEGIEFDKGYVSPYMMTDNEKMRAEMKKPHILITDQKITNVKQVLPVLEALAQSGEKDLVIIADDIEGEALATFILNKLRGSLNVLGIKAPGFGDNKKEQLKDIAAVTGATFIEEGLGMKLDETQLEHLGSASKVVATKDSTVIVGGAAKKGVVESYIERLKHQRDNTEHEYQQQAIEKRIAKISGGVAVIKVGAATESEMKYLKDKIEDAVNATKAALEEGIIPGGGSTLVKIAQELTPKSRKKDNEVQAGYDLVLRSLESPLRQIAINAGKDDGVVLSKVLEKGDKGGYHATHDDYVDDMLKEGIIDPVKVTKSAILNACSAASVFLTTEVAVADQEDEKESHQGGQMPAGMPGLGM
jgi:chaperonin GroEL